MSLESASWAVQLNASNPLSSDPRSQGDDHLRLLKSVIQTELGPANRQWIYTGHSANWATSTAITIDGDQTTDYEVGRRVKVTGSATGTIYGEVSSSTYSAQTRVNFTFDSGSLTNETLTTYLSILTFSNEATPNRMIDVRAKTADTTVTSSTTVTADPHLAGWTLADSARYRVTGFIIVLPADSNPDLKYDFTFDNAPSSSYRWSKLTGLTAGDVLDDLATMDTEVSIALTEATSLAIQGYLVTTTGGNMDFSWAPNVSTSSELKLLEGSWIEVQRL